jgi:hypothetical protein
MYYLTVELEKIRIRSAVSVSRSSEQTEGTSVHVSTVARPTCHAISVLMGDQDYPLIRISHTNNQSSASVPPNGTRLYLPAGDAH